MNEEEVLVGRIQDLAGQCYHRDVPSHTEFLTLAEQDLLSLIHILTLPTN